MRYHPDTQTWTGSATDLANHARCAHLTQRSRFEAREIAEGRAERSNETTLIMEKGKAHEAAYVASRRATDVELQTQVWLEAGTLRGYADLLERGPDGTWEPHEIKFARGVRPEHVLQALVYADAIGRRDGHRPEHVHVVDGRGDKHSFRTSEYFDYYRVARDQFEAALLIDLDAALAEVPHKVAHCEQCPFAEICAKRREDADHLSLVANMRREQITKLASVDITTLTALATSTIDHVPGIGRATLARHKSQARLQLEARAAALPGVEYRRPADDEKPRRGFALLPEPDAADMFFDFEGYPFHESGGLEYLWGWTHLDTQGSLRFDHLWASDPDEEAVAFTLFLDVVHERLEASPGMHVYHYAPYEITALRRLADAHPHEALRLDALLRGGVFVDLYAVVRQAMLVGTSSYSIKKLEPLYGVSRAGDDLADGGASIEVFEEWLLTRDEVLRKTIIDYNRVDCDSTLALRDWLLEHRDAAAETGIQWPALLVDGKDAPPPPKELSDDQTALVETIAALDAVADDEARSREIRTCARLLAAMSGWQWRTRREFFGDLHARAIGREPEDFIDEPLAIAGLELVDTQPVGRGSVLRTFRFPDQVTTISDGQVALDALSVEEVGKVEKIDLNENTIQIRTGPTAEKARGTQAFPTALVGWDSIYLKPLEHAAVEVGRDLLEALEADEDPFSSDHPNAATLSMLGSRATEVVDGDGPSATDSHDPASIVDLVRRAAGSHVIIQGPPGTGKTWTSARIVVALAEAGITVGISSNSHAAIRNILRGIDEYRLERAAAGNPIDLVAEYALGSHVKDRDLGLSSRWVQTGDADDPSDEARIIAGTAWRFAKIGAPEVMLIDEAGQVSLLHAVAMTHAAKTVVLVGDPQQLPQPSSAKHPHGCGESILEHLFEGADVLPPERALLLDTTRRMHPDVNEFISSTYYRGRVEPFESTTAHHVAARGLPRHGCALLPVEHVGNRVRSDEEVIAIKSLVEGLLADGRVVARVGEGERPIRADDIIIVAPYNAQRRALKLALGDEIAVGTVDKFQGQEAPVAILSLTASSRDELPRGLDFLLDPHRLNVAISRARALAIVVGSPALLGTHARTLADMRLLNDLGRYERLATRIVPSANQDDEVFT